MRENLIEAHVGGRNDALYSTITGHTCHPPGNTDADFECLGVSHQGVAVEAAFLLKRRMVLRSRKKKLRQKASDPSRIES